MPPPHDLVEAANIIFLTTVAISLAALVWQNQQHNKKVMSTLNDRLLPLERAIEKIGGESTATLAEIVLLREQLANATIPEDAAATLTRIEARVKTIDDSVPDAPAPAPEQV